MAVFKSDILYISPKMRRKLKLRNDEKIKRTELQKKQNEKIIKGIIKEYLFLLFLITT